MSPATRFPLLMLVCLMSLAVAAADRQTPVTESTPSLIARFLTGDDGRSSR